VSEQGDRKVVDLSGIILRDLDALEKTEKIVRRFREFRFPEIKFPVNVWRPEKREWEGHEDEIRRFYEDPKNIERTIFCPKINNDETDDWGMFGFGPGFIFVESRNYRGRKTLTDRMASAGLSLVVDPKTGLGVMPHYDYFPKNKLKHILIRKYDASDLFNLMVDIFSKKRLEDKGSPPALPEAKSSNTT